jgi:uncharacterized membrane protein YuzA (DUF378 family)
MGTFTVATGFGMLFAGVVVMTIIGLAGLWVINLKAQQKRDTDSRSAIQKQIEELRD